MKSVLSHITKSHLRHITKSFLYQKNHKTFDSTVIFLITKHIFNLQNTHFAYQATKLITFIMSKRQESKEIRDASKGKKTKITPNNPAESTVTPTSQNSPSSSEVPELPIQPLIPPKKTTNLECRSIADFHTNTENRLVQTIS
jgi:hypothetical protein